METGHIWTARMESPVGPLTLGATPDGVCLVSFDDHRAALDRLQRHFQCDVIPGHHPHLDLLQRALSDYFAGRLTSFRVPVVYSGNSFQNRVWEQLRGIPYGETCSYEKLAQKVGRPRAARAVGNANGLNRVCILIPCHRVIRKDGTLGGYGGGLWRKEWLLRLERRVMAEGHIPQALSHH